MVEVIGEWIKLHIEEHNDLNSPINMVAIIKFRRVKWSVHVASIVEQKCLQTFGC
jgi:hypothetical protein